MTKKKITPKEYTRSIEVIIQENPNLTGKEILAEQEYDKACFELWKTNINKKQLDFIDDINTNGGYYKGRFGTDQRFYYKITDAQLDGNRIYANVENIVVFLGAKGGVVSEGNINVEKRKKEFTSLVTYDLEMYTRTTKEDYEQICDYLLGIAKFW